MIKKNGMTSLLIALVFMFQSTAIFAKAVTMDQPSQVEVNHKMLNRLDRMLTIELRETRKQILRKLILSIERVLLSSLVECQSR